MQFFEYIRYIHTLGDSHWHMKALLKNRRGAYNEEFIQDDQNYRDNLILLSNFIFTLNFRVF